VTPLLPVRRPPLDRSRRTTILRRAQIAAGLAWLLCPQKLGRRMQDGGELSKNESVRDYDARRIHGTPRGVA